MKKTILALSMCTIFLATKAQTNLLVDGGFETYQPGPGNFTTITGGKVNGLSGKWQMVFGKGGCPGGCGQGSATIVTTEKKMGNNAIEIKVDTQVSRNDIKIYQSIAGTQAAGLYEVSFWVKASIASPVSLELLKGTQGHPHNGSVPFAGYFTATTQWQQLKFTTNIADWTDLERTEMRVSIRINTSNALPVGPYPKKFWIDDVSIVKK